MVAIIAAMIGAAKRIMPPAMSCGRIDLIIAINSGRVIGRLLKIKICVTSDGHAGVFE